MIELFQRQYELTDIDLAIDMLSNQYLCSIDLFQGIKPCGLYQFTDGIPIQIQPLCSEHVLNCRVLGLQERSFQERVHLPCSLRIGIRKRFQCFRQVIADTFIGHSEFLGQLLNGPCGYIADTVVQGVHP